MQSSVGANIKRIRIAKGISQNGLAKLSSVSQSAISSIEATTKSPSIDTIFLIAKALGVSIVELIFDPDELKQLTALGDELDENLLKTLRRLTPHEQQRMMDYAEGMIAARKD